MTDNKNDKDKVTPDNGPRPKGKPDECFYCHQKLGEPHKDECVILTKKIRVRAVIEFNDETVRSWDTETTEFRYNNSSWCASNIIPVLIEELDRIQESDTDCLCGIAEFTVLTELGEGKTN